MHGDWLVPSTGNSPQDRTRGLHSGGAVMLALLGNHIYGYPPTTTLKTPGVPPTPQPLGAPAAHEKKYHWPVQRDQGGIKMQSGVQARALDVPTKAQGAISPTIMSIGHRALTTCQRFCKCYIIKTPRNVPNSISQMRLES